MLWFVLNVPDETRPLSTHCGHSRWPYIGSVGQRHLIKVMSFVVLGVLIGCAPAPVAPTNSNGTPLELFAQLADLGALARACDPRSPDVVTREWVDHFQRRVRSVETRLEAVYGEAAVRSLQATSVHGCFGGTSQSYRREYEAVLGQIEAKLAS